MLDQMEKRDLGRRLVGVNFLLLYSLISIIFSTGLFAGVAGALGVEDPYVSLGGTMSFFMVAVQYIPFAIYNRRHGNSEGAMFRRSAFPWKVFIAGVVIVLAINVVTNAATETIEHRFQELSLTTEVDLEEGPGIGDYGIVFLYSVIGAPLVEELIYRGFLVNFLKKYGKSLAIVISGLCFGLMHGNIPQALFAAPLGMFLAYAYLESGSLWVPVIYHVINNAYATIFNDYLLGFLPDDPKWWAIHDISIFVMLVILGVACWVYMKYAMKRQHEKHQRMGEMSGAYGEEPVKEREVPVASCSDIPYESLEDHRPGAFFSYFSHWSTWLLFLWYAYEIILSISAL